MKFLLSLFLWIIIIKTIWSQEIPYIEHLSHREGKVETYYTKGSESKAEYLLIPENLYISYVPASKAIAANFPE